MRREAKPLLCYVTDRRALPAGDVVSVIRRAIEARVGWIQIREKDLATRPLLALAREAVAAAQDSATRILVNDRLDVALAAGAAGVHLGGESLPAEPVARWRASGGAPGEFLVGVSCHSLADALAAERAGADYLFFGPVFATPSKAASGPPQGLERLAEVCQAVRVPVLAIGGVTPENAAPCLKAGAAGIAAIRMFQDAADLAALVALLRGGPQPKASSSG